MIHSRIEPSFSDNLSCTEITPESFERGRPAYMLSQDSIVEFSCHFIPVWATGLHDPTCTRLCRSPDADSIPPAGAQNAGAAGIVREPEPHISHPPALAQQDVPRNEVCAKSQKLVSRRGSLA